LSATPGSRDALIFAEDPGAANFVADLPAAIEARGATAVLLAKADAAPHLQRLGVAYVRAPQSAAELLSTYQPKIMLVGTSENTNTVGLDLLELAPVRRITSIGLVDHPANPAHRFPGRDGSPLGRAPDVIVVADETTRQAFIRLGQPAADVVSCGHPVYDRARRSRQQLESVGRTALRAKWYAAAGPRPVVMFLSEISDGVDTSAFKRSKEYSLHGRGDTAARTLIVLEEVLDALRSLQVRPFLVLRLHPKDTRETYDAYREELDLVLGPEGGLESVFAADVVVGLTTTLLVEATILGRPTLSVVPRRVERNWLPGIHAGLIACADERQELRQQLSIVFGRQSYERSDDHEVEREFPSGAADRVAELVHRLVVAPVC